MTAALTIVALPPDLLEQVIAQQSAVVRASLKWNAGAARSALHRLVRGPLTDLLVDDVTAQFMTAVSHLARVSGMNLADFGVHSMRDEISERVRSAAEALQDDGACEALVWTWQQIGALFDRVAAQIPPDIATELAAIGEEDVRSALATEGGHVIRAEVLLLATLEAQEAKVPLSVQRELTWRAFEQMCAAEDAMATDGIVLFPRSGSDDHVTGILRAAESVRSVLKAKDITHLRAARVGDLR